MRTMWRDGLAAVFCAGLVLTFVTGAARAEDDRAERRQGLIERFDADGDGQLSESERQAARDEINRRRAERGIDGAGRRQDMLDRFDTDGDGQLSEGERQTAREARGQKRGERGAGGHGRRGHGKQRRSGGSGNASRSD